jgi:hypothetical protein
LVIIYESRQIVEPLRQLSLVKLEEGCLGVFTWFFDPLMLDPSFKPTRTMYIYFPQEGTILCYSTKNVPKVGESFPNLPVGKHHLREHAMAAG